MRSAFVGCGLVLAVAAGASADVVSIFGFTRVGPGNSTVDISSQIQVEVIAASAAATSVTFRFANLIGVSSNMSEIYFDDSSLLNIASRSTLNSTTGSTTPGFNNGPGANPPNLPGGNTLSPAFTATVAFDAGNNGLNENGDRVAMTFSLLGGNDWSDVIAAINSGALRMGMHIRSLPGEGGPDDESDAFVNTTTIVPLPPAAWAGLASLVGVCGFGYARRRSFRA